MLDRSTNPLCSNPSKPPKKGARRKRKACQRIIDATVDDTTQIVEEAIRNSRDVLKAAKKSSGQDPMGERGGKQRAEKTIKLPNFP